MKSDLGLIAILLDFDLLYLLALLLVLALLALRCLQALLFEGALVCESWILKLT